MLIGHTESHFTPRRLCPVVCAILLPLAACGNASETAPFQEESIRTVSSVEEARAFLDTAASADPAVVEKKIKDAVDERFRGQLLAEDASSREEFRRKIASGETDVWSLFYDTCLLGDSRAEPFSYLGLLPADRIYASKGSHTADALESLDAVLNRNPSHLFFTYGLNSVDGEDDLERFTDTYREVLGTYVSALPDTTIYICSIMPVTEDAVANQPGLASISSYNNVLKSLCQEFHCQYLNCDSLLLEHPEYYEPDGMHFVTDFYPVWAEYLMECAYLGIPEEAVSETDDTGTENMTDDGTEEVPDA